MSHFLEHIPTLPTELVFLIIEALLDLAPKRAYDLSVLSRNIQPIVERGMYRHVYFIYPRNMDRFVATTKSRSRPAGFFAEHVESVGFAGTSPTTEQLFAILEACPRIHTLAFLSTLNLVDALRIMATPVHPARLSCELGWAFPNISGLSDRLKLPFFRNLSHLQLFDSYLEFDCIESVVAQLTHLTHFSFVTGQDFSTARSFASTVVLGDNIVVFIMFLYLRVRWVPDDSIVGLDPRIVFAGPGTHPPANVIYQNFFDSQRFIAQWCRRSTQGGQDMWEEAEDVVRIQRNSHSRH
ncbi:hypothetical protein C8J56DRAFT_977648 [Mycena floridula]|nr:hypothetical protein C8J56DRAFT_977648 [Mycena floridula]